jgi:multiple sugar transport system ATP-binding protein
VASVRFDNVAKVYPDGTRAVSGMSLDITDGEMMVFVGPSGSGKSTALRMVAGLEDISEGVVRIGDRIVNYVPSRDRDIAMVFQSYALYPHLSVYENIAFGLRVKKVKRKEIDRRVQDAAHLLDITEYLKRKPRELSGGQRQRVAMGRAIVRQPQVFLMDEPLSNLDAKLRVQLRAEIARLLQDLGTTTIYVTHDQIEAMTMGHRVAVMRQGRLEQVDSPQNLYDRPANLFVAGFIGSPAMNMVEARLTPGDGTLAAAIGSQHIELGAETLATHPGLQAYIGKKVIVGIRPEELDDAALDPDTPLGQRLHGTVVLTEGLGAEIVAHFNIDARPALTDDVRELAAELGNDLTEQAPHTTMVGRFGARSAVREGKDIEVAVDARTMHFFDPDTGAAIDDGDRRGADEHSRELLRREAQPERALNGASSLGIGRPAAPHRAVGTGD